MSGESRLYMCLCALCLALGCLLLTMNPAIAKCTISCVNSREGSRANCTMHLQPNHLTCLIRENGRRRSTQ